MSLTGNKFLLNSNNKTDMTEQKSNVDESSKSPALKKKRKKSKCHFTPSHEKLQHLTNTSKHHVFKDVFKFIRATITEAIIYSRLAAIIKIVRKYISSVYLHRKIVFILRRILSQTLLVWRAHVLEEFGVSLWRKITLLWLRRDHCLAT